MSTKIYEGFKMAKVMSMTELRSFFAKVRSDLTPIAQEEYKKAFAKTAEAIAVYIMTGVDIGECMIDIKDISSEWTAKNVVFHTEKKFFEVMHKNKAAVKVTEFNYNVAFDVKVCLIPIPGKILGIYYADNEALRSKLLSYSEIVDYAYWNNTDRPQNVSAKAWKTREKDWNVGLPGIGIPMENGFTVDIIDSILHAETLIYNYERDIIPYLSPKDELENKIARTMLFEKKYNELIAENPEAEVMRTYFKARDYVKAHPEEVDELKKNLDVDVVKFFS